jgi:uncharacterized membrane protein
MKQLAYPYQHFNINSSRRFFNKFFNNVHPHKFFMVTATLFGILFLFITPPFQTPDEPIHFYRAYQITQGNFVVDQKGQAAGNFLPSSLRETVDYTDTQPTLRANSNVKYNIHKTKAALSIKELIGKTQLYDLTATAYYSPISYFPQASGILIARLLHQSPVVMMYAGRLFNLLIWVLFLALAIRCMPYKKWALVTVALIPMVVFDSISLGVDVMTYGLVALILALILRIVEEGRSIDIKIMISLVSLFSGLVLAKQVAFVFLPLVLLLPTEIFGTGIKAWLKKASLILIPLVVFAGWIIVVGRLNLSNYASFNANPHSQFEFIIHEPLGYADVLFRTYFFTTSDGIARSFIGTFGWLDAPLSELVATVGYIGLAFMMLVNYRPVKKMTRRNLLILLLVGILYWLAVTTALYAYYNPLKYKTVVGLQGRYFVPIAILAIPLVAGYSRRLMITKSAYKRVAIIFPLFMLMASTITIFYRYYVNS